MSVTFTMRQLLEAGIHFGHHTRRWNPKMKSFIFGDRNKIHIIDLEQTVPMLYRALNEIQSIVSNGGRVLFVGTKQQAADTIAESAKRCGQYYVNHRWLGGMMTNWKTISRSIKRLRDLEDLLSDSAKSNALTKKERLQLTREQEKLEKALGGIKEMGGQPDAIFIIDTNKEALAIAEAQKLNIPIFAVVDTNCNPDGIDYLIPGNDDASRAIQLYCDLVGNAVLEGLQQELKVSDVDTGAAENPVAEKLPVEKAEVKAKAKPTATDEAAEKKAKAANA